MLCPTELTVRKGLVQAEGIEPSTNRLKAGCSTAELRLHMERFGADEGIRTLVGGLEAHCSTIELHPLKRGLVPLVGLEPTRPCGHRILNPACLPVPTQWHKLSWCRGRDSVTTLLGFRLAGRDPASRFLSPIA